MDRELVEKVTRLVLETLGEMEGSSDSNRSKAVKIWSHQSPLPSPIILEGVEEKENEEKQEIIIISPYR